MGFQRSTSRVILTLIGGIFSLTTLLMVAFIAWMKSHYKETEMGNDALVFFSSSIILAITTAVISFFIWYIIIKNKTLLNQE